MSKNTNAADWWTHGYAGSYTCVKVSAECDLCWAEAMNDRFNLGGSYTDKQAPYKATATDYSTEFRRIRSSYRKAWRKWKRDDGRLETEPRRPVVWAGNMTDIFLRHDGAGAFRQQVWQGMRDDGHREADMFDPTPEPVYVIHTKRPGAAVSMVPHDWDELSKRVLYVVTAGTQKTFDARVPKLWDIPARWYGVSFEPLLEAVDITKGDLWEKPLWQKSVENPIDRWMTVPVEWLDKPPAPLHWCYIGAESGAGARPMDTAWAWDIIDAADAAGVAVWYKQQAVKGRKVKDPRDRAGCIRREYPWGVQA